MVAMAKDLDDERLVERFKRGDDSAFDAIVQAYASQVAGLANRLLGWPGDVDDLTQDVFLSAFSGLRRFRGQCSLKTWLFTITINRCRTYRYTRMLRLRRFKRVRTRAGGHVTRPADGRSLDAERFEQVRRASKMLPSRCREAIVLRYLEELPTSEICDVLGITANALQVRLNRGRERLRQELAGLLEE